MPSTVGIQKSKIKGKGQRLHAPMNILIPDSPTLPAPEKTALARQRSLWCQEACLTRKWGGETGSRGLGVAKCTTRGPECRTEFSFILHVLPWAHSCFTPSTTVMPLRVCSEEIVSSTLGWLMTLEIRCFCFFLNYIYLYVGGWVPCMGWV